MQIFTRLFSQPTPATPATETGLRELQSAEMAQVGAGLPKGGWLGASALAPELNTPSVEQLPKGGWSA